jgi:hypothetical protein
MEQYIFCEYGPLDRDDKNNFTDTFANLETLMEPTFLAWNKLSNTRKELAYTAKMSISNNNMGLRRVRRIS